jgi:hypothetical protein
VGLFLHLEQDRVIRVESPLFVVANLAPVNAYHLPSFLPPDRPRCDGPWAATTEDLRIVDVRVTENAGEVAKYSASFIVPPSRPAPLTENLYQINEIAKVKSSPNCA